MRVPWRDRQGKFQPLKAAVLAAAFIPGLTYAAWWAHGDLGARPLTEAIHGTGDWTVRWLMIALTISPFARLAAWPRLLTVRRIAGVTAMAYAVTHFLLYIADQKFVLANVVSEIVSRFYLTIGFIALLGLIALGATSTDAMMKRLARRWKQLHRLTYPIGVLALLHFYIQTKANVWEPVFVSGLFVWLMLWRVLPIARQIALSAVFLLVPAAAALTMALEFAWYGIATKIDPLRILSANWDQRFFPRPAHYVAMVALAVAVAVVARRWFVPLPPPRAARARP